ncbi:4-hydroxy-tetrahydrodipicolinate synthase family protein [Streptomyces meridianus]|uniref:4-hydroxy-tetrahydrodipicolinate synthase n=1 Tax=Streptomyces meridianus TaxID=2938945 RepID=A0ABT0X9S9_9ACTN|nr:4-hydroxy-tetrahydrodipicolinate synthase [Streptomyces meridianus]MCM2579277.1 4-hydroxy-tetrahydrodipicolinate synthase [Streptomyces meridianus]
MVQDASPRGIFVPLVTPFTTDGRIAVDALEGLAHGVLEAGADGLVALGSTGEAAALDTEEKAAVIDVCARVCRERHASLLIGAGSNDTRSSALALAELKRWPEATGALVAVPYFTRPSEAGVLAHFTRLAATSPVPLVIYHIPYRTAQPLGAATLRSLATLSGVSGVKYATGGVDQPVLDLLGDLPPQFSVLAGDDLFLSPMLALGAAGGILASAHLATGRFTELATAWRTGDVTRARLLGHALARLSAAAFAEPNPTVIKGVLYAQGRIPTPDVRLPLLPARPASVEAALSVLMHLAVPEVPTAERR